MAMAVAMAIAVGVGTVMAMAVAMAVVIAMAVASLCSTYWPATFFAVVKPVYVSVHSVKRTVVDPLPINTVLPGLFVVKD